MCTDWTEQASVILALARRTLSKTAGNARICQCRLRPGAPARSVSVAVDRPRILCCRSGRSAHAPAPAAHNGRRGVGTSRRIVLPRAGKVPGRFLNPHLPDDVMI